MLPLRRAIAASIFVREFRAHARPPIRSFMPAASALRTASVRPTVQPFQRSMQTRALSTKTGMPKFMFRLIRLPLAGFATAGGAYAYANYKVEGTFSLTHGRDKKCPD